MSDEIVSRGGAVVGRWNGEDVNVLQDELARIKQELLTGGFARLHRLPAVGLRSARSLPDGFGCQSC